MLSGDPPALASEPNMAYRYLLVQAADGVPARLVMAEQSATAQGTLETWVTAQPQVLQTLDGLLHSTHGLPHDLSPHLDAQPQSGLAVRWRPVAYADVPKSAKPTQALRTAQWQDLRWFEVVGGQNHFFAVAMHRGSLQRVYTHRCWAAQACLHTYRWPLDYTPIVP